MAFERPMAFQDQSSFCSVPHTFAERSSRDVVVEELSPDGQHDGEGGVVRVARPVDRHTHVTSARELRPVYTGARGADACDKVSYGYECYAQQMIIAKEKHWIK